LADARWLGLVHGDWSSEFWIDYLAECLDNPGVELTHSVLEPGFS
jgi:hypothetical protein